MLMSIIHLLEVNKNTERKEGGMGEWGKGKERRREGRKAAGREGGKQVESPGDGSSNHSHNKLGHHKDEQSRPSGFPT